MGEYLKLVFNMFFLLIAIIAFCSLLLFASAVSGLFSTFSNKSFYNLIVIITCVLIIIPPMLWLYYNFSGVDRWRNINNFGSFLLFVLILFLLSYILINILTTVYKFLKVRVYKDDKKTELNNIFAILSTLIIVISIFSSVNFVSYYPVVSPQECTKFVPGIGKNIGHYVKCDE
ncbi:hypothetical protein [Nostoc sp. FACHB-145]|uniref:hypothetical protein n=1 Tax=Nostoc sp. FACHB-145 TaxID=2692836 RepID=UPI001682020A|nr:hypothetical protein [Nostoc sp. FACHB-145]MBD2470671.1 hypothetical protein [Nostoc sp. FACHB-145]